MKAKRSATAKHYEAEFAKEYLKKKKTGVPGKSKEKLAEEKKKRNLLRSQKNAARRGRTKFVDPEKERTKWMKDWEKW